MRTFRFLDLDLDLDLDRRRDRRPPFAGDPENNAFCGEIVDGDVAVKLNGVILGRGDAKALGFTFCSGDATFDGGLGEFADGVVVKLNGVILGGDAKAALGFTFGSGDANGAGVFIYK